MQRINVLFLLVGSAILSFSGIADTENVGGYTWTYRIVGGTTVEIINSNSSSSKVTSINPKPRGYVTIPATLGGKPVASIGAYAFGYCDMLDSVMIPDSVTSVGDHAFYYSSLTSIAIPSSVMSIGTSAFYGCRNLCRITMSDGVKSIGESAFYGCTGLSGVTIPSSVTSIGQDAFDGCRDSLFDRTTVRGVKLVDGWAVDVLYRLSGVLDLTGVRGIGNCTFSGCSELTNVTLPNTVTSIDGFAFKDCSGLTSISIPDSVTSIGEYAFSGCSGLTNVTIGKGVICIGEYGFSDCSGLTNVTIGKGVTSIGNHAFDGCNGLTNVMIPDSVTSIGFHAFEGCNTSLYDTTTVEGLRLVDGWVVDRIGPMSGHLDLTGIRGIGNYAFWSCSSLSSVMIPVGVQGIGEKAFYNCDGLMRVTMPNGVKRIDDEAFHGCSSLTNVTIPSSVTSIGHMAFSGCSELTSMTIPDSVTSIGYGAFSGCSGLTNVTIPDSVTSIGYGAFEDCSGLTNVTIPHCVTSIGDCAFRDCSSLTNLTIPNSVTYIGERAFYGCNGLMNVMIPSSVTYIGDYAFHRCTSLTNLTIPNSVTYIGDQAFAYCQNLMSVSLGSGVTHIKDRTFYNCSNLASVTIPNGVTSIGPLAFYDCMGLRNLTISKSVTHIDEGAFYNCRGLTNIVFGGDAPAGVYHAFSGLGINCTVYVKRNSTGWGRVIPGMWNGMWIEYSKDEPLASFIVTFDARGGVGVEAARSVTNGRAVGVLPEVTRDGYTFDGWFTTAIGGTQVFASTKVTTNVTYYAHWTINQYTVSFNANGGYGGWSRSMDYGTLITAPTVTRTGYTFTGWSPAVPVTVPAGNTTYTAQWRANLHTVTFSANGGTGAMSAQTFTDGVAQVLKANAFKRFGYTFAGWAKSAGGAVVYADGQRIAITSRETLYACWTEITAGVLDASFAKAQTVDGALYDTNEKLVGTVQVKVGKISKKGVVKVSATASLVVDGKVKKVTAKAVNVDATATSTTLTFKAPIGDMAFVMTADGTFTLKNASYLMAEAKIGGALKGGSRGTFRMEVFNLSVPGTLLDELLPNEEAFSVSRGKWSFAKAASVKWAKPKKGAPLPEIYDEESGKGLIVDDSKGSNLSGMKLTYTPKTGVFKGSFKIYALEGSGKATKLKKYTVKVAGVVVDGVGHGEATCKKPTAGPWTVTVE